MSSSNAAALTFDSHVMDLMRADIGDDFIEMIDIYTDSTATLLGAISVALERADDTEVKRLAHNLKSSSASMGVLRLSIMAANIEQQASQNNLDGLDQQINKLKSEFERACNALRRYGK